MLAGVAAAGLIGPAINEPKAWIAGLFIWFGACGRLASWRSPTRSSGVSICVTGHIALTTRPDRRPSEIISEASGSGTANRGRKMIQTLAIVIAIMGAILIVALFALVYKNAKSTKLDRFRSKTPEWPICSTTPPWSMTA